MEEDDPHESLEQAEHAHHAAESGNLLMRQVAMGIAIMAVLAAVVSSVEDTEAARAMLAKNDAVLLQDKATDAWGFFASKSIKKNMYDLAARTNPALADAMKADVARNGRDEEEARKTAENYEHEAEEANIASGEDFERHHGLTYAATLIHMAIAIASLSMLLKRHMPLRIATLLSGIGAMIALYVFFR